MQCYYQGYMITPINIVQTVLLGELITPNRIVKSYTFRHFKYADMFFDQCMKIIERTPIPFTWDGLPKKIFVWIGNSCVEDQLPFNDMFPRKLKQAIKQIPKHEDYDHITVYFHFDLM